MDRHHGSNSSQSSDDKPRARNASGLNRLSNLFQRVAASTRGLVGRTEYVSEPLPNRKLLAASAVPPTPAIDRPEAAPAPAFRGRVDFKRIHYQLQNPTQSTSGQSSASQAKANSEQAALKGVYLRVEAGQTLAVVGAAGAGQKCFAQLLLRQYDPTSGAVLIDGVDVRSYTLDSLRKQIQWVSGSSPVLRGSIDEQMAKLHSQRHAPILLVEDPTLGLDEIHTEQVRLQLQQAMLERTTLLITNDLHLARLADKIVVLKSGRVEEMGTHKELLLEQGEYATLYADYFDMVPDEEFAPPAKLIDTKPVSPVIVAKVDRVEIGTADVDLVGIGAVPLTPPEPSVPAPAVESDVSPQPVTPRTSTEPFLHHHLYRLGEAAVAFQPSEIQRRLQALIFAGDTAESQESAENTNGEYQIETCELVSANLLDSSAYQLHYDLRLLHRASGESLSATLIGHLFNQAALAEQYLQATVQPLCERLATRQSLPAYQVKAYLLQSPSMVLHFLPIFGSAPSLLAVTDEALMIDLLCRTLPEVADQRAAITSCQINLTIADAKSAPQLRYRLECGQSASEPRLILGTIIDETRGQLALATVTALRRAQQDRNPFRPLQLPRILGYRPDLHLLLYETPTASAELSNLLKQHLQKYLADNHPVAADRSLEEATRFVSLDQSITASAQALAAIHGSHLQMGQVRTLADSLAGVRGQLQPIWPHSPVLVMLAQDWLRQITRCADNWRPLPTQLAHGRFRSDQVRFTANAVSLAEFDAVCQAEPAYDLGYFTASLRLAVVRLAHQLLGLDAQHSPENTLMGNSSAQTSEVAASLAFVNEFANRLCWSFVDAYLAAVNHRYDRVHFLARIQLYEALALIDTVMKAWRTFHQVELEHAVQLVADRVTWLPYPTLNPASPPPLQPSWIGETGGLHDTIPPQ